MISETKMQEDLLNLRELKEEQLKLYQTQIENELRDRTNIAYQERLRELIVQSAPFENNLQALLEMVPNHNSRTQCSDHYYNYDDKCQRCILLRLWDESRDSSLPSGTYARQYDFEIRITPRDLTKV